MPTETYSGYTNNTERWDYNPAYGSYPPISYRGSGNEGSRTFIRRPKPQTSFLKPLSYDVSARSLNIPNEWRAVINNHAYGIRGLSGGHSYFGSIIENDWMNRLPSYSNNLRSGVITDLRLKVKDQKVNLGQAFAERRMTANLLADTLTRIANATLAFRKGNWKQAKRLLEQKRSRKYLEALKKKHPLTWDRLMRKPAAAWKQAPASWLEFQYGWNPLINDVMGSIELLRSMDDPVDWHLTAKASRQEKASYPVSFRNATYLVQISGKGTASTFRGMFGRVDYHPSNSFLSTLSNNSGLSNPLLLQWELLPYSFVLDWGVQVGDWISSLDATQYMEFVGGSLTDRRELILEGLLPVDDRHPKGASTVWQNPSPGSGRRFELHREAWSSWPVASAPRFKDPLSLTHVANALSLLAEALKHGKPRVR